MGMNVLRWLGVGLLLLLAGGCATAPKVAPIDPTPEVHSASMGQSVPVALSVVDERPQESLGEYQDAFGRQMPVRLGDNLVAAIREKTGEALATLGFVPVHDGEGFDRRLRIEVLRLDYQAAQGVVSGELMVWAELRGVVTNGDTTYSVRYKMLKKKNGLFNAGSSESLLLVNQTLTTVLESLLQDQRLVYILSQ